MRKNILILIVLAALAAFAALALSCKPPDEQKAKYVPKDFLNAIPDKDSLALRLPGDDSNNDFSYKAVGDPAKYYTQTVQYTRDVNQQVLSFLSIIDEITSYPYSAHSGETYMWGPWKDTGLSQALTRFSMTRVAEHTYDYVLQWKPKDSQDESTWKDIWKGHVLASQNTARRGTGYYTLDFSAAASIDFTVKESGQLNATYDTVSDGREITLEYVNFVSDEGNDPLNADYYYHNHADNTGVFTFEWHADLFPGNPDQNLTEDAKFNTRWQSDGAGRTDAIVTGGDVAATQILGQNVQSFSSSECWDSAYGRTYYTEAITLADGTPWSNDQATEGVATDCAFEQEMPE